MDGLRHAAYQLVRSLLLVDQRTGGYLVDTLHLELIVCAIHGLGESIGKEQDGGTRKDMCLLKGIFPGRQEAYRDIGVTGQHTHASADEQRGVMTCIAVVHAACGQVEDTHEEGHKHVCLVHIGYRPVHRGHDAVRHRLMGRHGTEG